MTATLLYILIILFILFVTWHNVSSDPFSPWNITLFVWLIVLCSSILPNSLYPLSSTFYYSLLLWGSGLYISSRFAYYSLPDYSFNGPTRVFNNRIIILLYTLAIIFLPIYISRFISASGGFAIYKLHEIRQTAVEGVDLGLLKFVPPLCKSLLLIELLRYDENKRYRLIIAALINLFAAFAIMEKGYFSFIFISIIYLLYLRGQLTKLKISIYAISFLLFLVIFNAARSGILEGVSYRFSDYISLYVVSPSVAFSTLSANSSPYFGAHSFRFFYALLNSFGAGPHALSNWFEPVEVPIRTNVFTVMEPYYEDFGLMGVCVFSIFIGLILGFIYKRCINRNDLLPLCIYTILLTPLVTQFFQDGFFASLSTNLQIFIIIYISTWNPRMPY